MLEGMSALQWNEWKRYAELEPFGEERADLRMAIETASLGNIIFQVWTGKREAPFKVEDFMPKFEKAEPISKEDAIMAIDAAMMALVMATTPLSPSATSPQIADEHRDLGGENLEN